MRLCVPILEDRGVDSPVSLHFGRAPLFLIVDTETQVCQAVTNTNPGFSLGKCQPLAALSEIRIDAVAAINVGTGVIKALQSANIRLYKVESESIAKTIEGYQAGRLVEITLDYTCQYQPGV